MNIVWTILGIIALFLVGGQIMLRMQSVLKKGKPAPEVAGKAGKTMNSGSNTLFYFFSPSCRACVQMTPMIKNMAKTNKNVFPVDVSKEMQTAQKFGVMRTPTVVLVKDGKIDKFLVGAQTESKMVSLLNA